MSCAGAVGATCAVCGDRATRLRYSHYGAVSCFSCRAFFRRAVEKRSHEGYACSSGDNACGVTVDTRKKCPRCRFDKCVQVGMKHGAVQKKSEEAKEAEYDCGEIAEFPAFNGCNSSSGQPR